MSQDIVEKLKEKEREIRRLMTEKSKMDGKREQLVSQMNAEFGVSTLEAACDKLDKLHTELVESEGELAKVNESMDSIISTAAEAKPRS